MQKLVTRTANTLAKIHLWVIAALLFVGCSSHSASYHFTQKQIDSEDLSFEGRLKVDEYINAFPQRDLPLPEPGATMAVSIHYFQDVISTGEETTLAQIAIRTKSVERADQEKPLGLSLVLDVSGSMQSQNKFGDAKEAIENAVAELPEGTQFALVLFSDQAELYIRPTTITSESRPLVQEQIRRVKIGGGTNIEAGLIQGYAAMAEFSSGVTSRLILITDGQSNVGVTSPEKLAKRAASRYVEGARISTIGIGHDVDERMLRTIAKEGKGAYYFADSAKTLTRYLRDDLRSVMLPAAKEVQLSIEPTTGFRLNRVYGYEDRKSVFGGSITIPFGELNVDDWRILIVEITGHSATGNVAPLSATVTYIPLSQGSSPHGERKTLSTAPALTWNAAGPESTQFNRTVARNAVVFADALALIEVSRLEKERRYQDAYDLLSVQIANVKIARTWDDTDSMKDEEDTLTRVQGIIRTKTERMPRAMLPPLPQRAEKDTDSTKQLIKDTLDIAASVVPGPWSLIIRLFGAVMLR